MAKGRVCIFLQHSSSLCFLISHPLLCNWFSWNLPRMEMAGYSFDFAFLPSHVQVGSAGMFPWLSHLGHALGLWAVKCWEILCKSELVCESWLISATGAMQFWTGDVNAVLLLWVHLKFWFCQWAVLQLFKTCFFYTSLMLKPAAASPCPGDSTMVWALRSISG